MSRQRIVDFFSLLRPLPNTERNLKPLLSFPFSSLSAYLPFFCFVLPVAGIT